MKFIWHKTCFYVNNDAYIPTHIHQCDIQASFLSSTEANWPPKTKRKKCPRSSSDTVRSWCTGSIYQFSNPNTIDHKTNKRNKCAAILATFPLRWVRWVERGRTRHNISLTHSLSLALAVAPNVFKRLKSHATESFQTTISMLAEWK